MSNADDSDADTPDGRNAPANPPAVDAPTAFAFAVSDLWSMPRNEKYEHHLCHFMGFVHGRSSRYPKGTTFTRSQLLELQPRHVHDWLAKKAFGKVEYSVANGDRPTSARASHLEQLKKGVSFFMVNHNPAWCNNQGNPTKDNSLRKLIDEVKLLEVRGEGSKPRAKRALTLTEFRKQLEMLRRHGVEKDCDYNFLVKYPAMCLWQYHLIGRVDDTANFGMSNPKGHDKFDFALKTKVQWSKNVKDEQNCPDQILLGSDDR
jgi:hypothetical protein